MRWRLHVWWPMMMVTFLVLRFVPKRWREGWLRWPSQFYVDWHRLVFAKAPVVTRVDYDAEGEYFWGTAPDSSAAIRDIKKQLRAQKVPYSSARFGGVYLESGPLALQVYDALNNQGGYFIESHARLGGKGGMPITIIDT